MTNKADNMTESDEAPSNTFDPQEAKLMLGLSDLQFRFAMARLKGMNKSQAAREAGYQGDDAQIRSSGSTAARSSKVIQFLAWAEREGAGICDTPCDSKELRRILSKHARSADKSTAIRAAEALDRINQREAEREAESGDPKTTLRQLAEQDILLAVRLAKEHNIKFELTPEDESRLADEKAKLLLELRAEFELKVSTPTTVPAARNMNGSGALKGMEA